MCHDPITLLLDLLAMSSGPAARFLAPPEPLHRRTKSEVQYVGIGLRQLCEMWAENFENSGLLVQRIHFRTKQKVLLLSYNTSLDD